MKDADDPPLAIRDTWPAIQSVLHSAQTTTHSHSDVTLRPVFPYPPRPQSRFPVALGSWMLVPSIAGTSTIPLLLYAQVLRIGTAHAGYQT